MTHTVRLPKGWARTRLADVLEDVRNGSTARQSRDSGGIPVSRIETISNSVIDLERVRYIHEATPELIERFSLRPGDVLFSHINSDSHLGKTGLVTAGVLPLLHGMNLLRLRTHQDGYEPSLLHYLCDYYRHAGLFISIAQHAVNQSSINQKKLKALPIPVPPFPEQHRIVEAIESYLTRLDDAVASLERVQRNLERYRASVLKAAVEGRLVPTEAELARRENRSYEPASELMKRILAERKARWIEDAVEKARSKGIGNASALLETRKKAEKQYKEPEAPDTTDLPDLPEGWCWTTSDQMIAYVTSGSRDWSKYYSNEGALFVRTEDINTNALNLSSVAHVELPAEVEGKRSLLQPLDLLVTITGANVGRCAVVPEQIPEAYISQSIALVRLVRPGLASYFHLFSQARLRGQQTELERLAYGMGRPVLNLANIRELAIPLPPLGEMERLIERAHSLLSGGESIHGFAGDSELRTRRLRQSILKWAFEGKLVEQDPSDEPASALLERIKATREAAEAATPKRQRKKGTAT